ncbi:hypothetical protein K3G39_19255 [Pontibacter sp. HSC-14F20]|uniref:hypothetical protein n=1 Tax=Pontibacter sp. HSC-14F20 TaxID=2864136 RepID=UPI001C7379E9|nr:hypothetical protein [Pontibacter sp. HSC-14F20]MBX0335378.1 hypothetical protein [Pontibacter sp. HSC-14F20]
MDQVEHLPHPGPHPQAVHLLDLIAGQVGSEMGYQPGGDKQIIAAEQDLPHHLAGTPIVPLYLLRAQVIKAVNGRLAAPVAVAPDYLKAVPLKDKAYLPAGLDPVPLGRGQQEPQQGHQAGLAAADGPCEQDAFPKT